MIRNLAIVIPTYKIDFFEETLESLNNQTCKDFNVYVGIDASKSDFESVIARYKDSLNIFYTRFKENLGGKDLVSQWNRCIDLIQNEEWIWLFSDDDMMERGCVEAFYKQIENNDSFDLYHFDVNIINSDNKVVKEEPPFEDVMTGVGFLKKKNVATINSFVVEFIFRKSAFERLGGFQNFDLAWGSDVATWAKLGKEKGIRTIKSAKVLWRSSGINITTDFNIASLKRKLAANVDFFEWCKSFFKEISYSDIYYYMFRMLFHYTPYLESKDFKEIVYPFYQHNLQGKIIFEVTSICYPFLKLLNHIKHKII